jgi:hypothetical protein
MKKIFIISALSLMAIGGCKKGLDATLPGTLNPTTFPKTEADYKSLVTDVYKLYTSKWSYTDGGVTGDLFFGVEYSNIFLNDLIGDQTNYFSDWGGWTDAISKADFNFFKVLDGRRTHLEKVRFISKITKIIGDINATSVLSEAKKTEFEAEARAARGILMYHLLTMYGPVPFIDDPAMIGNLEAESNLKKPDRAKYVARVVEDLRFAADKLVAPTASEYGRFNKGCALTYLMRTYLNEKNWANAELVGKEIQTLGFALVNDYTSLFKVATEKNSETIWAISCDPAADGNNPLGNMNAWGYYLYPSDYPGNLTAPGKRVPGWGPGGVITVSWAYYDTYNSIDKRRNIFVTSYNAVNSQGVATGVVKTRATGLKGPVINKYPDEDATSYAGNDIIVCRYADVLLMLAESVNELRGPSDAKTYINEVRARAGLTELPASDLASKDAFRDAVLRERGWELFLEGQRRVDLMRMGKFNSALIAAGKNPQPASANGLFPVPQYMLSKGFEQTTGY